MKTKSLLTVSLIVSLFLCSLLLVSCDESRSTKSAGLPQKKTEKVVPSIQVKNELVEREILLEGKIEYRTVVDVSFAVGSVLEAGDVSMKTGSEFTFNTLLFKLNLKDAFGLLSAKKKDLANFFIDYQQALKGVSSKDQEKWMAFATAISPAKRLPELPLFKTDVEKNLLLEKNLFVRYDEVQQLEQNMEQYFYLAPFDGTVLSVKSKVGSRIKPNQSVARIVKKGEYKLVARVDANQPNPSSSLELFNDAKEPIGRAAFLSSKKIGNQKEFSFSIKLSKGVRTDIGQTVYVRTNFKNQKACYLPQSAVKQHSVIVFVNGIKQKKSIQVLKEKEGRYLVSGLKNGEVVLLEN